MTRHFGGSSPMGQGDKTRVLLVISFFVLLVVGGGILYLAMSSSSSRGSGSQHTVVVEREAEIKMVDVLVPVREIEPGTPLDPSMFRKESRPQVGIDRRVVKSYEEVQGFFARSVIVPGQPLHQDFITSVRPSSTVTAKIPEGFRAVTIRVDARTSVEGFTRPGAKVDVHWATNINGKPAVKLIVENAKVLSAERSTDNDALKAAGIPVPNTVTLLVTARDAAKIQLASVNGKLSLSLRGDTDTGKSSGRQAVTVDDLLDRPASGDADNECRGKVTMGGKIYCFTSDGKMVPAK